MVRSMAEVQRREASDPASDAIVEVRGVALRYGTSVQALEGVNLDIPAGQLTSFLGPSGCGKTTLCKIIAGLLKPTAGEVRIKGRVVNGPGPDRAFVFQDFALMPWATVLRNAAFGLELRGLPRIEREEIARKHVAEVGLAGFEDSFPHELSGGMRQRVGLARALAVDAEILMMDEPFASVDEQTRRKFQEDLLDLLRFKKKTVIFVTHSIEEAVYVSDQVVLLSPRPGRVNRVIPTGLDRSVPPDEIRRAKNYLDAVDDIWSILRAYVI